MGTAAWLIPPIPVSGIAKLRRQSGGLANFGREPSVSAPGLARRILPPQADVVRARRATTWCVSQDTTVRAALPLRRDPALGGQPRGCAGLGDGVLRRGRAGVDAYASVGCQRLTNRGRCPVALKGTAGAGRVHEIPCVCTIQPAGPGGGGFLAPGPSR
jgi:hypothetical protein